jgi:hypothetical protein
MDEAELKPCVSEREAELVSCKGADVDHVDHSEVSDVELWRLKIFEGDSQWKKIRVCADNVR